MPRFELSGSIIRPIPLFMYFYEDAEWDPAPYIAKSYTYFDAVCIGASGGPGGGVDTGVTNSLRAFGGGGGGGGINKVRGLLSILPSPCNVVVGHSGAPGTTNANPALTTDGSDGGPSIFNDANLTCVASGGKGGKRADSVSDTAITNANGGNGGKGGTIVAGGGGTGAIGGTPSPSVVGGSPKGTEGRAGIWNGAIGTGGGGGAGGVGKYGHIDTPPLYATKGGRGAYNAALLTAWTSGLSTGDDAAGLGIIPGAGGSAKIPLPNLPVPFPPPGDSNPDGVVVLYLTAI